MAIGALPDDEHTVMHDLEYFLWVSSGYACTTSDTKEDGLHGLRKGTTWTLGA